MADPRAFFQRSILENALMTPEQESIVRQHTCPKCAERFPRATECGGLLFRQCIGCGDIWVTESGQSAQGGSNG